MITKNNTGTVWLINNRPESIESYPSGKLRVVQGRKGVDYKQAVRQDNQ